MVDVIKKSKELILELEKLRDSESTCYHNYINDKISQIRSLVYDLNDYLYY